MTAKAKTKDMTKAELVEAIQKKLKGASPILRRGVLSTKDLMKLPKKELQHRLATGRVVGSGQFKGDVEYR